MNKSILLEKIKKIVINCKKCELYKNKKKVVFGQGNVNTKIIFIGEGPGKEEDEKGVPFCGKAGKILENLLNSIKLKREEIYITNVIKCRPPKNRKPKKEEIEKCSEYLLKQIKIINPEIIVCLGEVPFRFISKVFNLKETKRLSKIHGRIIKIDNKKIIPFFHPAYAIYNPKSLDIMKNDFKKLIEVIT